MTGPEHYRKAEELLGLAESLAAEERGGDEDTSLLAEAQVHATLALADIALRAGVKWQLAERGEHPVTDGRAGR